MRTAIGLLVLMVSIASCARPPDAAEPPLFPRQPSPGEVQRLIAESRAASQQRDLPRAIRSLEQAISLQPDHADAHRLLGINYLRSGNPEAAAKALEAARRLDPSDYTVHGLLGVAYVEMARYSEARSSLLEVLERKPDDLDSHRHLGDLGVRMEDSDLCLTHLNRYMEIVKALPPALLTEREKFRYHTVRNRLAVCEALLRR